MDQSCEPLKIVGLDMLELCAEYGQKHDLLNEPSSIWFCHVAKSKKET